MPPTLNMITSTAITKIRIRPIFFTISQLFYDPLLSVAVCWLALNKTSRRT
jgi:hypothetical protein